MNTVNKTALSNLKQNKGKNILTGIAIVLTTLLIFVIPTVGLGTMDVQMAAINKIYPTFHGMYRNVDVQTAKMLSHRAEIETMGIRQDPAQISIPEGSGLMCYMDDEALRLGKMELEEGNFPKSGNEIAVSSGLLDAMGIKAGIGDTIELPYQPIESDGIGYEKKEQFLITGMLPTSKEQRELKVFSALVSKDFMEQEQPEGERKYRVLFRVAGADAMTTEQIKTVFQDLAADMGIVEADVTDNSEYLYANYVDPAFYTGVVAILLVVVLAGILTIYSIYYISMIYKVQEFGKLKALGATKRQIRQIVFREGMLVAAVAIPIGLVLGSILSHTGFTYLMSVYAPDDTMGIASRELVAQNEVSLLKLWIYIMAAVVTLLTVAVSMIRPMQIAAKISPVEAMRYDGSMKTRKKGRKGHSEMRLVHLTEANLTRNKKRTLMTIITLSLTGILYMVLSTILSCADPVEIARSAMYDEFEVSIDSSRGDKMHPEREWTAICQNNPLNEEMEKEIAGIPGVKKITKSSELTMQLKDLKDGDDLWTSDIIGIPQEYAKEMEKSIIEGNCTYEELLQGDKIIMDENMQHWAPDWKLGDTIRMILKDGEKSIEKSFTVAAIADMPYSLNQFCNFLLPKSVVDELGGCNMEYHWSIAVDNKEVKNVEQKLRKITDEQEFLKLESYEEEVAMNEKTTALLSQLCYVFMVVLGGVGIMNLVNTMINSIYVRRRELGVMQAIGLSEKQMVRMLQMEGIFYTAGTLLLSLGGGSVLGYFTFLYAKKDRMFGIISYHYPMTQTIVLIGVVLIIQLLLTYLIMKNFRKQSMIERIRFSE